MNAQLSQTPYFIRALWQWCTDAGLSPQILVAVDDTTRVPRQFVVDEQVVLDISLEATNRLEMADDWITFQARFGEKVENIAIPMCRVAAIFAEETNQGMSFEVSEFISSAGAGQDVPDDLEATSPTPAAEPVRKSSPLKVVK